jgi:uncharacterized protein YhaN
MRIERLELDGFGRFHDASWPLEDGLTVLLGANEAGKTTLLNALRALLFGFEATRDGRTWYPAIGGGRRGGRLALRTGSGERWTVERHGERGGGGALAVRAPNGNQGGQETLDRLLHGADKDLFNNIFAFGLGELQTFASLNEDGVRGRIYGAGAGLGSTSAVDLERRLRQQMDGLFLPRGSQRPLNQLLARIEQLRHEIGDLARQPEEHADASRERDELRERAAALRLEAAAARERAVRLRQLREAGPIAAELTELERELEAGDASLDDLPDDTIAVLDRRESELAEARAVLATLDDDLEETARARAAITPDEAVLAAAEEIAVVSALRERRTAGEARRRDLESMAARQQGAIDEQMARVGGWAEDRLLGLDDSIGAIEATRGHEARLATARAAAAAADGRHRSVADDVDALSGSTGRAMDANDIDARLEALRELDNHRLGGVPAPQRQGPMAIAVALLIAALGALSGMVVDSPWVGLVGGTLLGGLAYLLLSIRRPGATAHPTGDRVGELRAQAQLADDAGPREIADLRDELVAERARLDVALGEQSRLAARRAELGRREQEVERAAAEVRAVEATWAAWLAAAGLPENVSPDAARHILTAAGTARRAAIDRDHHRRELDALAAEEAAAVAHTDALLRSLHGDTVNGEAQRDARVAALSVRLESARDDDRRGRELDERLAQLGRRREPVLAAVHERESALGSYLDALGCPDPDRLRRRAAAASARRAQTEAVRERRAQLAIIAGAAAIDDFVREASSTDLAALEVAETTEQVTLAAAEAQEREAMGRIGALEARIAQLEAAEELGVRRQELAILEGRAAAMSHEWAVNALALRLLEETRARYERERQPEVVHAAESHFERITGGRYARIVAPPGDASVRVETEGGESRATEELSRGTGEQLYLALRFGLIEEFARHAEPLPVVMDDILVNFDADRAARAASAIRDLAERHQVLYFTCHPWTAELLDPGGARTLTLS